MHDSDPRKPTDADGQEKGPALGRSTAQVPPRPGRSGNGANGAMAQISQDRLDDLTAPLPPEEQQPGETS